MHFERIPRLSASCYNLYEVLTTFGSDVGILLSLTLYNTVTSSLIRFFEIYFQGLQASFMMNLKNEQYCCLLANSIFASKQILPKLKKQLVDRFERIIPEMDEEEMKLSNKVTKFEAKYIEQTRVSIFQHEYPWAKLDYSSSASVLDQAMPTEAAIKMLAVLSKNLGEMDPIIDKTRIMQELVLDIFTNMTSNWM
jgi:hypothetical protein